MAPVMFVLYINITVIALYTVATIYCATALKKQLTNTKERTIEKPSTNNPSLLQPGLLKLITLTMVLHGIGIYGLIVNPNGLALGFFNMSSLIVWCINLIVLISGIRKPLHTLWLFLLPLSIVTVAISLFNKSPLWQYINMGIGAHIVFSILAYSLFTIAVLQAILLAWQNHQLKHHQFKGFAQLMPPLETTETLLFEIIWIAQILLTLGMVVGVIYIDDIFAQHLVHKTVLSLLAWILFSGLLLGRHWVGWRGNTAIRWIFGGFCLLMLAFFGSKLVLEIILQRSLA